jgi:hypothetical protein
MSSVDGGRIVGTVGEAPVRIPVKVVFPRCPIATGIPDIVDGEDRGGRQHQKRQETSGN